MHLLYLSTLLVAALTPVYTIDSTPENVTLVYRFLFSLNRYRCRALENCQSSFHASGKFKSKNV